MVFSYVLFVRMKWILIIKIRGGNCLKCEKMDFPININKRGKPTQKFWNDHPIRSKKTKILAAVIFLDYGKFEVFLNNLQILLQSVKFILSIEFVLDFFVEWMSFGIKELKPWNLSMYTLFGFRFNTAQVTFKLFLYFFCLRLIL